jgi:hypothetical protein
VQNSASGGVLLRSWWRAPARTASKGPASGKGRVRNMGGTPDLATRHRPFGKARWRCRPIFILAGRNEFPMNGHLSTISRTYLQQSPHA